uniref:Endonuclease/exonuclease/phosphatase domain-containing protein n=1 Tax=Timema genevievae TaxID=629358 RepID=A0A7R9K1T8_TIMGE|nr:unnamed protein product [Timema genevievae]
MILRNLGAISRIVSKCHVSTTKSFPKNIDKMQNAYFRYQDGEDHFQLSFQFSCEHLRVNRQFNFSRKMSETITDFLGRVCTNLERTLFKKKKKIPEGTSSEMKVHLYNNGEPVSGESICKDILFNNNNKLMLQVQGKDYYVIVNAPWVVMLSLPSSIMAGFPVYPNKVDTLFSDKNACEFKWLKSSISMGSLKNEPVTWVQVGEGYFYTPSTSDIGHKLKLSCVPKNGDQEGPQSEVISSTSVGAGPGMCPFEKRHVFTKERLPSKNRPLYLSSALAQAAPPTLSTAWTAPQSMFSKPSVTSAPLYTAPKSTPASIGSHDGHYPSNLHAPMGSPCFSHWTKPGSSGGYLTRAICLTLSLSPPSPYLPPGLTLLGLPHVPPRLPHVPPRLTLPKHPSVPPRLTLPEHTRRPFPYPRVSDHNVIFRVVSYNILADLYADSEVARTQLYPYCPSYALTIDYRKQLILRELLGYNADLICLQEVDSKIFDLDLTPVLGSVGYEGVFHRKAILGLSTEATMTKALGGKALETKLAGCQVLGCLLLDTKSVVLAEELKTNSLFSDIWKRIEKNCALAERFLARTTCLQCTVLESVEDPREQVIVGNTHLYFHPNADHIRLLQGGITIIYLQDIFAKLLSMASVVVKDRFSWTFGSSGHRYPRVSQIFGLSDHRYPRPFVCPSDSTEYHRPSVCPSDSTEYHGLSIQRELTQCVAVHESMWPQGHCPVVSPASTDKRVSMVLCGDFNSTPECGVYQLFTTQFVPEDCIDWKSKDDEAINELSLSHSLLLGSAYGTPAFTNFTAGFVGCLDYIFYQIDQLEITQVVPLPSIEDVTEHTALPSVVFPSDHVALVADLRWKPF